MRQDMDGRSNMADGLNAIRVLNETELCRMLGISNKTFERMRYRGDVPPKTQLSDRRVGYRVCDVEEWLDRRRQADDTPPFGAAKTQIEPRAE
jgi:predicted DNA-binding transcriptional regulator AlpA